MHTKGQTVNLAVVGSAPMNDRNSKTTPMNLKQKLRHNVYVLRRAFSSNDIYHQNHIKVAN